MSFATISKSPFVARIVGSETVTINRALIKSAHYKMVHKANMSILNSHVIKKNFMLNSAEHKIYPAHKCKMPTV